MTRPEDGQQRPLSLRWETRALWPAVISELGLSETGAALAIAAVESGDWVSYSRNSAHYDTPARYRERLYTYRRVVGAVDHLDAIGLIDNDRRVPGKRGWQSALRARPALVEIVNRAGPRRNLPVARLPEVILLRDRQKNLIDYRENPKTLRMRKNTLAIQEAIGGATILPDVRAPLVRIFNGDMQHGGRFFALGKGAWQGMNGEVRLRLLIDGEPVAELDFKSLHPALLYAEVGHPPPADCYDVPPWPRPLVKRALLIAINATTKGRARGALARREEMSGTAEPGTQEAIRAAARLLDDLRRAHRPIAHTFGTGAGLRLMRQDGDIAEAVLMAMLRQGIVCLPVHDSFIVAERHVPALEGAMIEAAERHGAMLRVIRK